jgi:hypothetical protein
LPAVCRAAASTAEIRPSGRCLSGKTALALYSDYSILLISFDSGSSSVVAVAQRKCASTSLVVLL